MAVQRPFLISRMLLLVVAVLVACFELTGAQIGVCNGMLGAALPPAQEVEALYSQNGITRMRIYNPDQPTLQALKGTNIELLLGVPNGDLQGIGSSQDIANQWVQTNVVSYPDVKFRYIAVGNEISPANPQTAHFVPDVLPAMRNIHNAISTAGLDFQIKVSTSLETGLLGSSSPPSTGAFREDVQEYIIPIINFLVENNAPYLANVYPYFAYSGSDGVDLSFAIFTAPEVVVNDGPLGYKNMFDAIVDALYSAIEKTGASGLQIVVSETGWATAGGKDTSVENARTYISNLVEHVKGGTPKRPGKPIETYIFAMFDEDQKDPEVEKHWGLFSPNKEPKYPVTLN